MLTFSTVVSHVAGVRLFDRRLQFRDLVVPADVVQKQGECITVPFTHSFLDVAPRVGKKGKLSSRERDRLEHFFHPHSA